MIPSTLKEECTISTRSDNSAINLAETYVQNQKELMLCEARRKALLSLIEGK